MGNEEPLTRWEVRDMIYRAISEYDIKQDARHKENTAKLDEIKETLVESGGVRKLAAWGIPILVAILSIVAEIIRSTK